MDGSITTPLPRIAVLISGGGSNLQALIDAIDNDRLGAEIAVVVSNRPDVRGLERASLAGIPTEVLSPIDGELRHDYDQRLAKLVAGYEADVVVMAGWLRILSSTFIEQYPNRIINLHPALPGELPGLHAIERAWQEMMAGERERTGVMVHLVPDEGVDNGPVLASAEVPFRLDDTLESLSERIHQTEHRLLVEAVANFLSHLPHYQTERS